MFDTIIIGIGPAGLSSAIYTARAGLKTLIIGKKEKTQLWKSHAIENYFGVMSLSGKKLLEVGVKQVKKFKATIIDSEVVNIKLEGKTFVVKTAKKEFIGKTLILATGTPIVLSGIKNEEKFTGMGVHYCVVCDGFFYKNKKIAVIGNADYAAEEALELLKFTKDITIISNGKEFEFSPVYKKAITINKIKLIKDKIKSFEGKKKMEKLVTAKDVLVFDGAYMALGCAGAGCFAKKFGIAVKGNVVSVDKGCKTNVPGIYAAGTCTGVVSQVATCVGEGCIAAMSVIKQLKSKEVYLDYGEK